MAYHNTKAGGGGNGDGGNALTTKLNQMLEEIKTVISTESKVMKFKYRDIILNIEAKDSVMYISKLERGNYAYEHLEDADQRPPLPTSPIAKKGDGGIFLALVVLELNKLIKETITWEGLLNSWWWVGHGPCKIPNACIEIATKGHTPNYYKIDNAKFMEWARNVLQEQDGGYRRRRKTRRQRRRRRRKTRRKRRRRKKISKGGFIFNLPPLWERDLKEGIYNPQADYYSGMHFLKVKKPGKIMNCATCVEALAGLPWEVGTILSIWSEHGHGIGVMEFLKFMKKYFSVPRLSFFTPEELNITNRVDIKEMLQRVGYTATDADAAFLRGSSMAACFKWLQSDESNDFRTNIEQPWDNQIKWNAYAFSENPAGDIFGHISRQYQAVRNQHAEDQKLLWKDIDSDSSLFTMSENQRNSHHFMWRDTRGPLKSSLHAIKKILETNTGVITFISFKKRLNIHQIKNFGHYIVLAKNEEGKLLYIDPQRKRWWKGINTIANELEYMGHSPTAAAEAANLSGDAHKEFGGLRLVGSSQDVKVVNIIYIIASKGDGRLPALHTAAATGGGGGGEEDDDDTLNMSLRRNVGNGDAFPKKWDKLGLILNPEGFQNPAFKQGMARVKNIYGKKQDPRVPAVCAAVCSGRAAKTMPSSLPAWKSDHYTKTQDVEYFL